jgi:hypothetical protein
MTQNILFSVIIFGGLLTYPLMTQGTGELTREEAEKIQTVGKETTEKLISALKSALAKAMREGGPKAAIEVCSEEALKLTSSITRENPELDVKRTSRKFRNPKNAPDRLESEALEYFENLLEDRKSAPFFLQKAQINNRKVLRYYEPLRLTGFCLNCHGTEDRIPGEVLESINQLYPDDLARGYTEGDFRGLVRVELRMD